MAKRKSRQRAWQIKMRKAERCTQCGGKLGKLSICYCDLCRAKESARAKKRAREKAANDE